jgi:hypothetical protein
MARRHDGRAHRARRAAAALDFRGGVAALRSALLGGGARLGGGVTRPCRHFVSVSPSLEGAGRGSRGGWPAAACSGGTVAALVANAVRRALAEGGRALVANRATQDINLFAGATFLSSTPREHVDAI